ISYTRSGNVWKGSGTVNVPTGGKIFGVSLAFEFDDGKYKSGSLQIQLPFPGIPLDLSDTPPQLYLDKGGLSFGIDPLPLGGNIEFGITPLADDFVFRLDGGLNVSFGNPVTITVTATGFLYSIQVSDAKLVYALPDSVVLDGNSGFDLGVIKEQGKMHAVVDPKTNQYGASIESDIVIDV